MKTFKEWCEDNKLTEWSVNDIPRPDKSERPPRRGMVRGAGDYSLSSNPQDTADAFNKLDNRFIVRIHFPDGHVETKHINNEEMVQQLKDFYGPDNVHVTDQDETGSRIPKVPLKPSSSDFTRSPAMSRPS